jgi:hypothetical protein
MKKIKEAFKTKETVSITNNVKIEENCEKVMENHLYKMLLSSDFYQ